MTIDYACECINKEGDVTYGAEFDTIDEAIKQVDHYRELIKNNGEEDEHSHIEISKETVDEEGNILSHKVIKTYNI